MCRHFLFGMNVGACPLRADLLQLFESFPNRPPSPDLSPGLCYKVSASHAGAKKAICKVTQTLNERQNECGRVRTERPTCDYG